MARDKRKKTVTYIIDLLRPEEQAEIDKLLAIEDVWWGRWHVLLDDGKGEEHWCYSGEDGHRMEHREVFGKEYVREQLLIDMRAYTWTNSITGEVNPIGWVPATRILPWEKGVVPESINWFIERFFGVTLFGYQLYFYYQTTAKMMIVGGRGSAKTSGLGLAMAAWAALHPGQAWAHFAFTAQQATEAYSVIEDLGSTRIPEPGQTIESAPKSFYEIFIKHHTRSPYPSLYFRPWDIYDSGNVIYYRPLGQARGGTTTRSMDVRRASLDEVTYDLVDKSAIQVAEGTVRGQNEYWLRRLSKEEQSEVRQALYLQAELGEKQRASGLDEEEERILAEIKDKLRHLRITCHLGTIITGNRGPHIWIDEELDDSLRNPEENYSRIVSYLINPHLGEAGRRALELTYDDPAVARVELFALRAIGRGTWFDLAHLLRCENKELDKLMEAKTSELEPNDYSYYLHGHHLTTWQMPYNKDKIYVLGGDPGSGTVPRRDSWNIQVWEVDLDIPSAILVYWRWGNLSKGMSGSWIPFFDALDEAIGLYNIPSHDAILQVGGQEKGLPELAYAEKKRVTTIDMTAQRKAQMANYTKQLIAKHLLFWPAMNADLTVQLSDWEMNDKDLVQDLVMALFGASWRFYQYFYEFINKDIVDADIHDERRPVRRSNKGTARRRRSYGRNWQ